MADWNNPTQPPKDNSSTQWSSFGATGAGPASDQKSIEPKLLGYPRTTVLMFIMLAAGLGWVSFAKVKAKTGLEVAGIVASRNKLDNTVLKTSAALSDTNPKNIAMEKVLDEIYIPIADRQVVLSKKVKAPFNPMILNPDNKHESDEASIPKLAADKFIVEDIIKDGEYFIARINGDIHRTGSKLNNWEIVRIDETGVECQFNHNNKTHTKKLLLAEKPASLDDVEVSEIIKNNDGYYAIVDGEEKSVNDLVENWRITEITADKVKVQFADKVKFLKVNTQAPDINNVRISGIYCNLDEPNKSTAWIDGREYRQGQKINGWIIVKIKEKGIVVKFRNRTEEILMSED